MNGSSRVRNAVERVRRSLAKKPKTGSDPTCHPTYHPGLMSGYSTPQGEKRFWGNGDGRFIYPPLSAAVPPAAGSDPVLDAPASSIRWEMLREGIEDWEMLYLLRELVEQHRGSGPAAQMGHAEPLLKVPATITRDMTTFTTDPRPIHQRRAEIARAIETLLHEQPAD